MLLVCKYCGREGTPELPLEFASDGITCHNCCRQGYVTGLEEGRAEGITIIFFCGCTVRRPEDYGEPTIEYCEKHNAG